MAESVSTGPMPPSSLVRMLLRRPATVDSDLCSD